MFERFLTYARARRALKVGQFEDVIRLLDRPEVRGERRSEQLREQALTGILQRAQRRNEQGSLRSALDDVEVLLSHAPEFDGAVSLKRELEGRCQADQERVTDAAQCLQRARELADAGELAAARGLCQEALALQARAAEHAAVVRHIEGLERIQDSGRQAVTQALKAGDLRGLRQHLAWLRAASGQDEEVAAIHQRVSEAIAADLTGRLAAASNPTPVLDQVQEDGLSLEGLLDEDSLHQEIQRLAHKSQARVREELAQGAFAEAAAAWQGLHEVLRSSSSMGGMAAGMPALADALERRESGDLEGALDRMRVAARELDCAPLDAEIGSLQAAEAELHEALNRARDLASGGRLLRAREELVAILEVWPMHETTLRQLDILNQQTQEREARLQQARALAKETRLAQASGLLMELASDTDEGREARLLLKDVHRRMDVAARGLSQVRRAVHGQATANREGLRHCIARLEEIGKLQSDLVEVEELRAALLVEIECLGHLEAASASLQTADRLADLGASGAFEAVAASLAAFEDGRHRLLHKDRLAARYQEIVDEVLQKADTGLHSARLSAAQGWLTALPDVATEHPAMQSRFESLGEAIASEQRRAEEVLENISEGTDSASLSNAAEQLGLVRSIWSDNPRADKLESKLLSLHAHSDAADEVERMTGDGDVRGARKRLDQMPPTPGFLRTRIFDIKQGLAKAQGLETGFLMRVDEGGEFLVLRGESISIGNVREGKADLLLLANISGRHARIQRSLSFHGGMEDRIVADKGEVFVNGKRVESAALRSGDRVGLGTALAFTYQVAGKRSLTAALQLSSGFQVAGTDKILLMKDRGRDGRILIGTADDCHVRVPNSSGEVEVYSASDGQIRVRFPGDGEIGGCPFRGEHPAASGGLVRCGDTTFVLQPWTRGV